MKNITKKVSSMLSIEIQASTKEVSQKVKKKNSIDMYHKVNYTSAGQCLKINRDWGEGWFNFILE